MTILIPSRRDVLKGASALTLGASLGSSSAHAQRSMTSREKELYELAKKEGEVTWYTAHSNDTTAQALGRDFEAAFPGIKANVVRTTAQVAYQRLTQEQKAGAMQVDVFSSTDIGHYVALKEKSLLEKYVPENASRVIEVYKNYDPDGFYTVTSAGLIGIGYNTAKLKEADAPKNWTDLTDPKWKDKIALGHPGFSGYVGTWVVSLKKLYGWDFFERISKNNPQIGRSINDTVTMLNAGERVVAGSGPNGTVMESAGKGNPLAMIYPPDGTVLIIAPSGIPKGVKHPNAAKLFMEYLLTVEASKIWVAHFNESMRSEVKPLGGAKSAADVKTIRPTVEEITSGIPEVIKQWRDTFGV
ncbi:MAG: iron(III) transport system substrate-binding protein [Hyphomicrobiales bacterium]|jgi:iron(III) transport system substrate-binding protein|nr:iron(III) transport system substrate-binding protein [Hyphomicrobiales bacterium]